MKTLSCFLCDSDDDVKLCFWQYVAGSPGVIRPVCAKCRIIDPRETEPGK